MAEYQLTVSMNPRRQRDKRGLVRLIRGLGLGHQSGNVACNAAKLIAEHQDVISVTVDLVIVERIGTFGHGVPK